MQARRISRPIRYACVGALGLLGALHMRAFAAVPWDLTQEDLQEALERGDLDGDAYEQLLDLFRARAAVDTANAVGPREPVQADDFDSLLSLPIVAPGGRSRAACEIGVPLRGTSGRRDWLLLAPAARQLGAHWEFSRTGAGDWRVYRGYAWWQSSRLALAGGSFDLRWIDGLVVGVAPAFLKRRETFAGSLVQPDRGRLNGLACDLSGLDGRLSVIVSQRTDTALAFRVYGLKLQRRVRSVDLSAAAVRQAVQSAGRGRSFAATIWGLEARQVSARRFSQVAFAAGPGDWAAQGRFDYAAGSAYRVGLAVWRVGVDFRNPLADGSAEADREPVYYPELDRYLISAATGERGGELRLRFGRTRGRGDVMLRYWREQPARDASMRAVVGYEPGRFAGGRWRLEWRSYRRTTVDAPASFRHEWSLRTRGRQLYALVRLRAVQGDWSPFGRLGGRWEVGFGPFYGQGRQSLMIACNDYDFAADHSAYLTIHSAQTLRVSRRGDLVIDVNWRTAYRAHPAALQVRFTSRVTL